MTSRQTIAEKILSEMLGQSVSLEGGSFAPCPGSHHHTKASGRKDFRVVVDGAPTGYCFHTHCGAEVDEFNKRLRREVWFAENGSNYAPSGHWGEEVAPAPKADLKSRPPIARGLIEDFTRGVPAIGADWLRRRSPVDVAGVDSKTFLSHLYREDERVLIFTDQWTQGDFCGWKKGDQVETFRLSQQRGTKAVPSGLPVGAREGVWFLAQPVSGKWEINPRGDNAEYSRRSLESVTSWRFFVLESDELDAAEWLKVLVSMPFPIVAIYTSGGRSIHALVMWDVRSKAEWDAVKNTLRQFVCPLGADPAALTAVRLTRLPGCKRGERMQTLLYLAPEAHGEKIILQPELRA